MVLLKRNIKLHINNKTKESTARWSFTDLTELGASAKAPSQSFKQNRGRKILIYRLRNELLNAILNYKCPRK